MIPNSSAGIYLSRKINTGKSCMNNCVNFAFFFFKWLPHKLGTWFSLPGFGWFPNEQKGCFIYLFTNLCGFKPLQALNTLVTVVILVFQSHSIGLDTSKTFGLILTHVLNPAPNPGCLILLDYHHILAHWKNLILIKIEHCWLFTTLVKKKKTIVSLKK